MAMPQASDLSLARPMMSPRLPAINPFTPLPLLPVHHLQSPL
jgi:hypothetical protein